MSIKTHKTDVAVIGAGPAGLFTVFECGMMKMKCHVIDALEAVGGQCSALYPEKPIYDIPAHPEITGGDLINRLVHQADPFGPVYHLGQQVVALCEEDDGWRLETSTGTVVHAKAVILAAGVGAFGPNRPPLVNIEKYEGQGPACGVNYLVKSREDFRDKNVVIAGGGDSAVDWALSLSELAASVSVVHRRPKFRAAPESVAKMEALAADGVIDLVIPYQLKGLAGEGKLTGVIVESLDGDHKELPADVLLPFFGLSQNLGPITDWGLDLDRNLVAIDPATCNAGKPGVFAVGDIVTYPGKQKLILTGFAEAAIAAHSARAHLYPDEVMHFEYSTTKGVPDPI